MDNTRPNDNFRSEAAYYYNDAANAAAPTLQHSALAGKSWPSIGIATRICWSVAVPIVVSLLLGSWVDARRWTGNSWSFSMLVVGLIAGCANGWHCVLKEEREQRMDLEEAGDWSF